MNLASYFMNSKGSVSFCCTQDHKQRIFLQMWPISDYSSNPQNHRRQSSSDSVFEPHQASEVCYWEEHNSRVFRALRGRAELRLPSIQQQWLSPLNSRNSSRCTFSESVWWYLDLVCKSWQVQTLGSRHFPCTWKASLSETTDQRQLRHLVGRLKAWWESDFNRRSSSSINTLQNGHEGDISTMWGSNRMLSRWEKDIHCKRGTNPALDVTLKILWFLP